MSTPNKYKPHQGKLEILRRRTQMQKLLQKNAKPDGPPESYLGTYDSSENKDEKDGN